MESTGSHRITTSRPQPESMLLDIDVPYLLIRPCDGEEAFYTMGEDAPWELLDGRLVMAAASLPHEEVQAFLLSILRGYAEERELGLVVGSRYPMRLDERWSPEPDVMFVRAENRRHLRPRRLEGPADFVIEIGSAADPRFDLREKRPRYQEARVPEMWWVDLHNREVIADVLHRDTYHTKHVSIGRLSSFTVSGFWIDVGWLWRDRMPHAYGVLGTLLE